MVFRGASAEARHTRDILEANEALLTSLKDAETGQRGFLLTGQKRFLAPYESAIGVIPGQLRQLEELVGRQRASSEEVRKLAPLVTGKLAVLKMALEKQAAAGAGVSVIREGLGIDIMDQIRAHCARISRIEDGLLISREELIEVSGSRTRLLTTLGSGVLFVLILLAGATIAAAAGRREQLIHELQASERRTAEVRDLLQTTLSSIGDAVIATGVDGRITFLNPAAQALTEHSEAQARGKPLEAVFRIVNETTRESLESPATKVLREGAVVGLANHTILIGRNGTETPIDDSGAPIRDRAGAVIGVALVFRDITERQKAEVETRRLASIVDFSADAIVSQRLDGVVLSWNAAAAAMFGYTEAEMVGRPLAALALEGAPADPEGVTARLLAGEPSVHYEAIRRRKDGSRIEIAAVASPLRDGGGRITGISRICRDVTERKRAEAALRESESQLRLSAEAAQIGTWNRDLATGVIKWSPGLARLFGIEPEKFRGTMEHLRELIHPDDRQRVADALERAVEDRKDFEIEYRLAGRSGEPRWLLARGNVLQIDGKATAMAGVTMDITSRKRLEDKLRQAQKLESLGILAGGIAHDFNNLLVGILGNASVLLEEAPGGAPMRDVIENLIQASERAAHLTRQMLAYSGKGRFVVERLNLARQVREILVLIDASIPKNVKVELRFDEDLPEIEGDAGQIQQLIMNLVINGAEAIGHTGGSVSVSLALREIDESYVRDNLAGDNIPPGAYVVLEVHDTGMGMDAATQAKIFDPFFTTKFTGRGLGLAAVLGIVRGHRGALTVYSQLGRGATFKVFLPVARAVKPLSSSVSPVTEFRGEGTLLVVDDEELVRRTLKTALERYGYRVLLANDGAEALRTLAAGGDGIALVLLDMTMPGMSGEEALNELRTRYPELPVIATSGYNEMEALRRFGAGLSGFIQKPYTPRRLAERIREALEKDSTGASA